MSASAVSPPYPMARPGYGKRSVPEQPSPSAADFDPLPLRERYVAAFIERLPEGATMSVKALAKQIPLYGQQAVSSALTALSVAGHLRRVRCAVGAGDQVRWVFRTYWSRTAHDNEWWTNHLTPEPAPAPEPAPEPAPVPVREPAHQPARDTVPAHTPAYLALAGIGRADARLALSAADCTALEALAERWFARGVDADYLTRALTAGLPARVDSPVGFVRRRLHDKIPPALPTTPTPPPAGISVRRVMMECTECGTPGHPEALPDGLCHPCRHPEPDTTDTQVTPPAEAERDVTQRVAGLRDLLKAP
ncbi:MarR family transcriptional regulator [Streptomyces sp. NPDC087428]|uniref:MarR family transcriptional regulator n=1 Tax=Streptomyces sp. NPDC087428 TaxID=3365788 RepID=UPI00382409BA